MNNVIIDPELRGRLHGLQEQLAFCDEAGETLGLFLPLDDYKRLLAAVQIPFSAEEIARRRQEAGGCSLAEIWQQDAP